MDTLPAHRAVFEVTSMIAAAVQLRALPTARGHVIMRGMAVECHCHVASCAATLRKFVAAVDKRGEARHDVKPPRLLRQNEAALVEIELEKPLPLECEADCRHLGRIVLRCEGESVAAALVVAIVK